MSDEAVINLTNAATILIIIAMLVGLVAYIAYLTTRNDK